jgi:hypothetical protein
MDFDTPRLLELLRNPAEDLSFEIKEWLNLGENAHKAKLAQAMIALANHGGGAVLLGYAQQPEQGAVLRCSGLDFLSVRRNGILIRSNALCRISASDRSRGDCAQLRFLVDRQHITQSRPFEPRCWP